MVFNMFDTFYLRLLDIDIDNYNSFKKYKIYRITIYSKLEHLDSLFNPKNQKELISVKKVTNSIAKIDPNKACDINGISPGINKYLPAN